MNSVKANVMYYYSVTSQNHYSLLDIIINICSAHQFETDLNFYNTDVVDYISIVNDSPVGFIDVVFLLLHNKTPKKLIKTYICNARSSAF